MIERAIHLDSVFGSLSHPLRRDILRRVSAKELSVSDLASAYRISLAAIAKHLDVLEGAALVVKRRSGKEKLVSARRQTMDEAAQYLLHFETYWEGQLDSLESHLARDRTP